MKLRSISAVGLKGPNFSHQLSEATAIIGPNAAGKTRILQAIRLALGGYLPECGKTPRATWELASGRELHARVEFDDGTDLHRKFWLDGATVKTEATGIGVPDLPLLNAEAYFELTDSKRTEYVFERIKLPDTYTPAVIISECERISFEEAHTEQVQTAKGDVVSTVQKWFGPADERAGDPSLSSAKPSVQEALGNAINELRELFTYWNGRQKATQGAVTTLAELKLRETSVVAAARGVDQEIEKAQAELDRLNTEKGQLQAKQDEAERTAKRKKAIRTELDADRNDYPRMIQKIDDDIKTAEARRIACNVDDTRLRSELAALQEKHRKESADFAARAKTINEVMQTLEELEDLASCPYCKSKGKGWQVNLERELKSKEKLAKEAQVKARAVLENLDASIAEIQEQIRVFDEACNVNSAVGVEVVDFIRQRERTLEDQKREETRRQELTDEFDGLNVLPESEDLSVAMTTATGRIAIERSHLSQLQTLKEAETRLQQQLVSAAQAELEHQDAAAHVLVIKAIAKLLKEKREAMIEEAFGGLLAIANNVTDGILKRQLALHEGTIGMWSEGGKFIPHRVFSGTEKALAYIAIAVALSSTAPLKLVILDEFGRLDEENQMKVLLRLSILQLDGLIDQFIVVGTSLPKALKSSTEASQVHLEVIEVKA